MLAHRLRRWPNIGQTLGGWVVFAGMNAWCLLVYTTPGVDLSGEIHIGHVLLTLVTLGETGTTWQHEHLADLHVPAIILWKGATIQYPGGGGIIYFNPVRRLLKISNFITCLYRTVLDLNNLFYCTQSLLEMIYFKKTRAPPWKLNASPVIRYDTIRYDTIRYYTMRYDTIRYDTMRYDTIRYDTIRYDTIRYDTIRYDTIRYDTIRYDAIRYDTIRYDTMRYDTIRYDTIRYDTIRYDTIRYDTMRYHTIPYHTIPYHTIPYHTIPYHTIPYHTIPYDTILQLRVFLWCF